MTKQIQTQKTAETTGMQNLDDCEDVEHVTTIAGPQAEALLKMIRAQAGWTLINKSVEGLAIVEFWAEK